MSVDNKLSEQGLVVYKVMHERISDLKKQQRTITNYVVLLYGAIFVVAKELGTLSGWQKCLTIGALLLTGGYGLLSLFKVQYDLGKARKRLDDAESHIFSMDEARWFGIERDSDPYLRGLLFTIALGLVQILGATFVAVYLLAKS